MRLFLFAVASIVFPAVLGSRCEAQCFDWKPGFTAPGVSDNVVDQVVFDDGSGPALYVAGDLLSAEDHAVNGIARWDGQHWSAVGGGDPQNGRIHATALAVYDDGGGPALYAGATGVWSLDVNRLVRWNGTAWIQVAQLPFDITDLCVHDDGTGPALYVSMKTEPFSGGVRRWDGANLTVIPLPATGVSYVDTLCSFDDGSGPALYAGGGAGFYARVNRWNGTQWTQLGGDFTGYVKALCVHDSGSGPALYAGGGFDLIGGAAIWSLARWSGSQWVAVGGPITNGPYAGVLYALTSFDLGSGPRLYAGGAFTGVAGLPVAGIASWDGAAWSALATGLPIGLTKSFGQFDPGSGMELHVGGTLSRAGAVVVSGIARWDGASWSSVTGSTPHLGLNNYALALKSFDDGTGPALYAGGSFTVAGDALASYVAKLTPTGWQALGGGTAGPVYTFCEFDDGSGLRLYAGLSGAPGVRMWNGTNWSIVGSGLNGPVLALAVFDDGSGPALYAGGQFGSPGAFIARWNGSTWSAVGGGMNDAVGALAVFDDGSGPALYAGGKFEFAGGVSASRIAKWNGSAWSALGSGIGYPGSSDRVYALQPYTNGGGSALAVAGKISLAGGASVGNAVSWNGTSWSALGFTEIINELKTFDDGMGSALYAAQGSFYSGQIVRWTGSGWQVHGGGFAAATTYAAIFALESFDDGSGGGPDLYIGGGITNAHGTVSLGLAAWRGCAGPGKLYCFGDNTNAPCPCNNTGAQGRGCANSVNGQGALLSSNGSTQPDTVVLTADGVVPGVLCAFLQGDAQIAPIVFGDGLRCVGGSLRRLYIKSATGSAVAAPQGAEPSLTARSALLGDPIAPGAKRHYQVYYRDGNPAFCPPPQGKNWNVTGALEIGW